MWVSSNLFDTFYARRGVAHYQPQKLSTMSKKSLAAVGTPLDELKENQTIAKVAQAKGSNIYEVTLPQDFYKSHGFKSPEVQVEMPPKFRQTVWVKRGGFVVVDVTPDDKIAGDIIEIVVDDRTWRKMPYWPAEFKKVGGWQQDSDEEEADPFALPDDESDEEEYEEEQS